MRLGSGNKRQSDRQSLGLMALWEERGGLGELSRLGLVFHHLWQACRNMITAPVTSLLTVVTISLALSFLACFVLLLENARHWLVLRQSGLTLSVFLRDAASQAEVDRLSEELTGWPEIEQVRFRSKADALAELAEALGSGSSLLQGLEADNPLPRSLSVKLRPQSETDFEELAGKLSAKPQVETVQYDRGLLSQIGSLVAGLRRSGLLAALVVLVMSSFIIASTIRLAMYSHREETEIMRLVGASEAFIRVPYLIQGSVQGALGGCVGIGSAYVMGYALSSMAHHSAVAQLIVSELRPLSTASILLVILSGILVGLGGSYTTVRRLRGE